MGVRFPSGGTNTILGSVPATGAETVLFTTPQLILPLDFAQVFLFWELVHTIGTGTTSYTVRLRRGTTTGGTLINIANSTNTTAGNNVRASGCYTDIPGAVTGQQYSLSVSGVATTGAFTTLDGTLIAFAL